MTEIILTGAGGLLGSAFSEALAGRFQALGRDQLDANGLIGQIVQAAPRYVVNCAAHTDVEGAERDPAADAKANARLPATLAEACSRAGATLVHFSSTGCYGTWKTTPYVETDPLRPTTTHHRNKAEGEAAIEAAGCDHVILRTGWLYGGTAGHAKNFVWKRLLEARGNAEMTSDAAQCGVPTFVGDLVRQTGVILESGQKGTFNATAQGSASRFEYVSAIVRFAGLPCIVKPGAAFKRLAQVSPNETAVNARLKTLGLDEMPSWEASLKTYVDGLIAV